MFRAALAACLALPLTALPALCQDRDLNADGFLDRNEYEGWLAESPIARSFDSDGDGVYLADEVSDASYAMMDLDSDGVVTVDEWDTWVDTRVGENAVNLSVAEWDEDGDGIISRQEFDDEQFVEAWWGRYDADFDGDYGPDEFAAGSFDWWDRDGDGILVQEELPVAGFAD